MKLSQYAKQQGVSYRTALDWFRNGTIKGYQAPSGTIIVYSFTARLYGERRAKRKTEAVVSSYHVRTRRCNTVA
ncbi:MAG TPA: hypothetical protein VFA09_23820 [Ktedonobacteraceae bacterium]|nr:hypothetical protein [Ktedonobacteraceae bacterium]